MKLRGTLLSAAMLLAFAQFPLGAAAQATKLPATAPATLPSAAATAAAASLKSPVTAKSPADWIQYEDTTFTPVLDDVSSHLAAVRTALAKKDNATAAQIKTGKIPTAAALDKQLGKASRADLERRWLVSDVTTWYPVAEEPQRHFSAAAEAYAKKDYQAAATEVRKAAAYVRLESARAVGDVKQSLDAANGRLEQTAQALDKGALKGEKEMDKVFANANHALALAHRAKAAESWARKAYDQVGYELKATAHGFESAATWTGTEAKAAASTAAADARAVGDKLGQSIRSKSKASPFDVGL